MKIFITLLLIKIPETIGKGSDDNFFSTVQNRFVVFERVYF